jgi:hypothetical protein
MDIAGFHIPSIVGASGTYVSVYNVFSHFERLQTDKNRKFVSKWLKGLNAPQGEWGEFFMELFRRVFGDKHLSLKCLLRSIFLTLALMVFLYLIILPSAGLSGLRSNYYWAFLIFAAAACATDYFSLWKTRAILTRFETFRSKMTVFGIVVFDFVGTTLIFLACWVPLIYILTGIMNGEWGSPLPVFIDAVDGVSKLLRGNVSIRDNTFYITALLTSVWLWAYIVVAYFLRLLSYAPVFVQFLSKAADLDNHPVRTIGYVVAAFCAVFVALVALMGG